MEEKILSLLVSIQADMMEIKTDLKQVNKRLENLKTGQKALKAGQKVLENRIISLEAGQESIKQYIRENNLAIAEIITEAFEENARRSHNGNVYRLIPVES